MGGDEAERADLEQLIADQCDALNIEWAISGISQAASTSLSRHLYPHGLHVLGSNPQGAAREDMLDAMMEAAEDGGSDGDREAMNAKIDACDELGSLIHALDGGYVQPAPGGDIVANPDVLPTGRNIHGFDPFRIPSAYACMLGADQAEKLIARHVANGEPFRKHRHGALGHRQYENRRGSNCASDDPSRSAAASRFLWTPCRCRVDPTRGIRPAAHRCCDDPIGHLQGPASAANPHARRGRTAGEQGRRAAEQNFVRKHSLSQQKAHGCDIETAALRVFSNAEGPMAPTSTR